MSLMDTLVSDLSHASVYDPVKAHEYYLRTRELKGRSTSGMTEKQREGAAYVKSKVTEDRDNALALVGIAKKQDVEKLRATAQQRRQELSEKLRAIMESLSGKTRTDRENVSKDVQRKIDALPEIPKGLSKEATAKLVAERNEKIAQIREAGQADRDKVTTEARSTRDKERTTALKDRETVRTELKDAIEATRVKWDTLRDEIKANADTQLDEEFENIRRNV